VLVADGPTLRARPQGWAGRPLRLEQHGWPRPQMKRDFRSLTF